MKKSDASEKYLSLGQSIVWIYAITVGTFVVSSWLGFGPFCRPKGLHEFGDFLAGVFSPLAFLFFVISVLIQREEFRLSRTEMADSRKELENQAAQMQLSAIIPILEKKLERDLGFIDEFLKENYVYVKGILDDKELNSHIGDKIIDLERMLSASLGGRFMNSFDRNVRMENIYTIFFRSFDAIYGCADRVISMRNDINIYKRTFEKLLGLYMKSGVLESVEFSYEESCQMIDTKYCMAYVKCMEIYNNYELIESIASIIGEVRVKGKDLLRQYQGVPF